MEKNAEEFGACFTPHGHGHNYILDAYVEGPVDSVTGMVINLRDLDEILKSAVQPLDNHHLNYEVPEFKTTVPTTENIAAYLYGKVKPALSKFSVQLKGVRLFENENLWVDYSE